MTKPASTSKKDQLGNFFRVESFDTKTRVFYQNDGKTHELGAMWLAEPVTGIAEGHMLSLQSALANIFPKGTTIQVAMLATPEIDDVVFNYQDRKNAANPVVRELTERHAHLMKSGSHDPIIRSTGVHLCKKRLMVTLKCQFKEASPAQISEFNDCAEKLESGFSSAGIPLFRAGVADYLMICRQITHIYDKPDNRYEENLRIGDQVFYAGDEVQVHDRHLQFNTSASGADDFCIKALSPKTFPRDFNLAIMNYVLGDPRGVSNQITDPYFVAVTLRYPDQVDKKAEIEKKAQWIDHQMFGGSTAKFVPSLAAKKEGFDVLRVEMENSSSILVEMNFTFWLYGRTAAKVTKSTEDLRTYLASLGFEMRQDKLILDVLFNETMPLNSSLENAKGLHRYHSMTATQAVHFLPLIAEWKGTNRPTIMMPTRRGELGGIDFYNSDQNYNAVIVAASGSGKSFLTQRIIADYLAEGAKVWVIDSGRSYQKLAAAVGGTFMEFSPDAGICLNPFTSFLPERGGSGKNIDDEMDFLCSLVERMAAQRETLNDLEIETLKKAIRQTFTEHQGYSTIANIADWLIAQVNDPISLDLARRLDSFSHGQYAKIFNDHSNVDMSNDFVVLELDDLKSQKQLQQVVLLQLVSQVSHEMYLSKGRKKILIIDEAWELLDDPIMAKAMETAYRKARKYDGSVITVTQGIADLYKSRNSQSMIENASWKIFLQQNAEAIDDVAANGQLRLEEYHLQMLKSVHTVRGNYSELMVVGPGGIGIFRLVVDRFTQILFSTTDKERHDLLSAIDEGKDVIEEIKIMMMGESHYSNLSQAGQIIMECAIAGISEREIRIMMDEAITQAQKFKIKN